jgi:V/A-type H+-transporting ATPase subunit E
VGVLKISEGLQNIIKSIESDSQIRIQKILQEAHKKALAISSEGEKKISEEIRSLLATGEKKISSFLAISKLNAKMKKRKKILNFKNKIILSIMEEAKNYVRDLPSDEYFSFILKIMRRLSIEKDGTVFFSKKDLERLPSGFEDEINSLFSGKNFNFKISSRAGDDLDCGFILISGKIEENCTLSSIFQSKFEDHYDLISRILFF